MNSPPVSHSDIANSEVTYQTELWSNSSAPGVVYDCRIIWWSGSAWTYPCDKRSVCQRSKMETYGAEKSSRWEGLLTVFPSVRFHKDQLCVNSYQDEGCWKDDTRWQNKMPFWPEIFRIHEIGRYTRRRGETPNYVSRVWMLFHWHALILSLHCSRSDGWKDVKISQCLGCRLNV